ncbi:MAG: glycosyltransferase family 4 protein [Clostridia bacterium]|nr:glycosyltransferase family 4 protein [Clostridia bacterium]
MKILLVNHFPLEGSGSGVYTKNLAKALVNFGHQVKIIFPEHEEKQYEGFESRVILFKGPHTVHPEVDFNFPCFTSHPRSNTTYYELTDQQMKTYIDKYVEVVQEEVDRFKPDLIHAQHLWITPYAAMLTGVPYVITAHGTDLKGFVKDNRYHSFAIEAAAHAEKIITISKQVDEETEQLYHVPADKRVTILNGYDETLFKPVTLDRKEVLKEFEVTDEADCVVAFAGKLTHFKGVDVLLKAAKHYEGSSCGKVTTLIAGNGELYGELMRMKSELGLDRVHFLGHVNQETLVKMYNIADVSVVPSRTEPFGLVAIEALACGTPVVGTNQGGLPDFIDHTVGRLVEVEDDLDLADAIMAELACKEKDARRSFCAEYAVKGFSLEHSIGAVEELYKAILKTK